MTPVHFASPAALWLLALSVVPLLLTRRRPSQPPTVVGNLYLWRDISSRAADRLAPRRRRLTPLALVEMLTIAAMALALSGPTVDRPASHVTLVVDLSASMAAQDGATTRLGTAIARAHELVQTLPAGARVRVMTAAATAADRGEYRAADPRLARTLDALTPTAGRADLATATAMARADDSSVVVLSDQPMPGENTGVDWLRVGRAAENVAVSQLVVRRTPAGADALIEVHNFGVRPGEVSVEVAVDGRRAAVRTLHLPAGDADAFTVQVPAGGVVSARLLTPDALPIDDIRLAAVPQPPRVALIGASDSFVGRALAANSDLALQTFAATQHASARWRDFDVVVCDGCSVAPARARNALLISPAQGALAAAPLALVNGDHPLAAAVDLSGASAAAIPGAAVSADDVIVRAGELPALTAYERDGQRVAELRVDLARGDFALSPAFPIVVADALQWLVRGSEGLQSVTAGEPMRVGSAARGADIVVTGPDGRPRAVTGAAGELVTVDTAQPGVYRVRGTGDGEHVVVVNAAVEGESDLRDAAGSPAAALAAVKSVGGQTFSMLPVCALAAVALAALEWRYRLRGAV